MIINREWAIPDQWTFRIPPIKKLIYKYGDSFKGWVDPFAGENSPAEFTNDINPDRPAKYHLDSLDFVKQMNDKYNGCLFDPPYSYRQVSEHYKDVGITATQLDTSSNFYNRIMNNICSNIIVGGVVISFGWNSNGFGKNRGFEIIEILLVSHGGRHNDTICTVERKVQGELF